jgi:hypothetical protein
MYARSIWVLAKATQKPESDYQDDKGRKLQPPAQTDTGIAASRALDLALV